MLSSLARLKGDAHITVSAIEALALPSVASLSPRVILAGQDTGLC